MSEKPPVVDRTVSQAPGLTFAGLILLIALLGLIIVGARFVGSQFRGLDQSAVDQLPTEAPRP